jgi:hypothetical protein
MNKKDLELKDFPIYPEIVLWSDCEKIMGKRMYKRFLKFMFGQTVSGNGVYPSDLNRFLKGLQVID